MERCFCVDLPSQNPSGPHYLFERGSAALYKLQAPPLRLPIDGSKERQQPRNPDVDPDEIKHSGCAARDGVDVGILVPFTNYEPGEALNILFVEITDWPHVYCSELRSVGIAWLSMASHRRVSSAAATGASHARRVESKAGRECSGER